MPLTSCLLDIFNSAYGWASLPWEDFPTWVKILLKKNGWLSRGRKLWVPTNINIWTKFVPSTHQEPGSKSYSKGDHKKHKVTKNSELKAVKEMTPKIKAYLKNGILETHTQVIPQWSLPVSLCSLCFFMLCSLCFFMNPIEFKIHCPTIWWERAIKSHELGEKFIHREEESSHVSLWVSTSFWGFRDVCWVLLFSRQAICQKAWSSIWLHFSFRIKVDPLYNDFKLKQNMATNTKRKEKKYHFC